MKRKIYLELGITLIVGFLIGFLVNSAITNKRIQNFSPHKGEIIFWKRALIEIQTTEEQRQAIFPIIREYSKETKDILQESWKQIPPIWDEMETEILKQLSPEQQKHIKILQSQRKKHHIKHLKSEWGNGPNKQYKPRQGPKKHHTPPPPHPER
jgi:hypothetical protein